MAAANDELLAFLESYTRLQQHDEACLRPIGAAEVTAWVFKDGAWTHVSPDRALPAGESWCHAYLSSLMSRNEYQQAKKDLFSSSDHTLNGLYKHNHKDLFAIVYRPLVTWSGVAFFPEGQPNQVAGHVTFESIAGGVLVTAFFSQLPQGPHGFHIHKAGDLRGQGCQGACAHYHVGPPTDHGDAPSDFPKPRHTGDLGNVAGSPCHKTYELKGVDLNDLYGRSVIVHADPDDLGQGPHADSKTTGHSGPRIACAVIGRAMGK